MKAVVCWRLSTTILPTLGPQQPAYDIQVRAIPAVVHMERRGFKLDLAAHAALLKDLQRERAEASAAYAQACSDCGLRELGLGVPSTPQEKANLLTTLLTSKQLQSWQRTPKAGGLSTRRRDLRRAAGYPPIVALVQLATIDKLLSSFGPTLASFVSPATGRIHAHYLIAGTASGRASCSGPNLQQIPRGERFRALFTPEPGAALVVADYASMELRAAAHISSDRAMTEAFEQDRDLHCVTASKMTGKPLDEVTKEERNAAKAANFGMTYGMGARGLVQSAWNNFGLVLTEVEAVKWLDAFTSSFPTFARWRRAHATQCEAHGAIMIGRDAAKGVGRLYPLSRLPPNTSAYTRCCNLPVQGACADAAMLALAAIDEALLDTGIEGGPVAWLHDEIVLEVHEDRAGQAAELLKKTMIDAFLETFPGAPVNGLVKSHVGMSWGDAKP
jgi:DNA polymerase-1